MKKRIFKGIAVAMVMLSMTMTVMATNSIVGAFDTLQATADKGTVSFEKITDGMFDDEDLDRIVNALNDALGTLTVEDAFGDDLPSPINLFDKTGLIKKNIDLDQYKFLTQVMNMDVFNANPTMEDLIKITFVANNMTSNMDVDILIYCEEHGWEVLDGEKLSNNQIAAYFHCTGPVALIYKLSSTGGGSDVDSPQTGNNSIIPLVAGMVVLAGFGGYALMKSKKEI